MKIHPLNCLIAALLGALLAYAVAAIDSNVIKGSSAVGAFLSLSLTLAGALGISYADGRTGVNVRIVSFVFFIAALLVNLLWAWFALSQGSYVVTLSLVFLLYVLIAQAIYSTRQ
ncbi:hypothetical protein [Rugamonas sp.]|uniref:hypothetical protein n=1 Tax=Rugamonas sp. TaxID=1926287 RepID=UPI0025D8879C|nr:hypothetical protein [Rugamonas sp.]